MILLDTNIFSEFMRGDPDSSVQIWLRNTEFDSIGITAITAAELHYGLSIMSEGKRKNEVKEKLDLALAEFGRIVMPFDYFASRVYARIMSNLRLIGRPVEQFDGMIAAICLTNEATLATRNVKYFQNTGVNLVNPFAFG